ncbi:MAG: hypothetical protein GY874_21865 [Desulfobacteraceae bacterium]|nr:hypothetical protein [Desulfobacteraceae bacterium]
MSTAELLSAYYTSIELDWIKMDPQAWMFTESSAGVVWVDGKFKILKCNKQFCLISKLPDYEITDRNFQSFLPDKQSKKLPELAVNVKIPFVVPHKLKINKNEIVTVGGGFYPIPLGFPKKKANFWGRFMGQDVGKSAPKFAYMCVRICAVFNACSIKPEKLKPEFTNLERLVLIEFLKDKSRKEIAMTLNLKQKTVRNYIYKIKKKLAGDF